MGSKKYPVENDYDVFMSKHGGSENAYTEGETTTYYFSIPQGKFDFFPTTSHYLFGLVALLDRFKDLQKYLTIGAPVVIRAFGGCIGSTSTILHCASSSQKWGGP
jgi:hypothetical protein